MIMKLNDGQNKIIVILNGKSKYNMKHKIDTMLK